MKQTTKRLLSAFLTLTMMLSLCVTASAASIELTLPVGDTEQVYASQTGASYEWFSTDGSVAAVSGDGNSATITAKSAGTATVTVKVDGEATDDVWEVTVTDPGESFKELEAAISPSQLTMQADGASASLRVSVSNGVAPVVPIWKSSNTNVVEISGVGEEITVTPVGPGTATISVDVSDNSPRRAFDSIPVTVTAAVTPVEASVLESASEVDVGKTVDLSAFVIGGSGSYSYTWETAGCLELLTHTNAAARVMGANAGSGTVTLYVTDEEDPSNSDTLTWNIRVNGTSAPMSVSVAPQTMSLSVGESGTLNVSASGGSDFAGNYEYAWTTNNGIVTVSGSGSSATVRAGSAGTALVTVTVTDRIAGTSSKATCAVTVKSKDASYNAAGTATVNSNSSITNTASQIATAFQKSFGVALSSGASVRLTSPSDSVGQLRLSNGTLVAANTSYTYSQFSAMYLYAGRAGAFSTAYTINDNGNVLTGTLTITASGGRAVTSVSISQTSIELDEYSSYFLNIGVMPSNAAYTVTWTSSNTSIAYVDGNGPSVTVHSRDRQGSAIIMAVVQSITGEKFERYCTVNVSNNSKTYNPSLTLTVGSDYYGTNLADNFRDRYRSVFGYALPDSATIRFSSLGSTNVAVTRLSDGTAVRTNTNYSFAQYAAMSVTPVSAGTVNANYTLNYNNNILSGTITIYVRSANVSATISNSSMTLAPNSSQSLSISVTPANSYYSVSWTSSNTSVATVSGSGGYATVSTKSKEGTATITATVTDRNGVKVVRSCTVTVRNQGGNVYNPSLTMTLGVNYTGTSLSNSFASQFKSVYGLDLQSNRNSAKIRFSSVGNTSIAVTHLSDGKAIAANTDYTFAQYISMYVEPISAGSFNVPYTLTYSGKSLTGTIMLTVAQGSISSSVYLTSMAPYTFSGPTADGAVASTQLANAITNAVGTSWSFIRFTNTTSSVGTLYQNSSRASANNVNVQSSALGNLYFVPAQLGKFSASFIICNAGGGSLATGTLYISVSNGIYGYTFNDVRDTDWFGTSVKWAVNREITNGMTNSTFEPYTTCTTAHILTFLWRAKGCPAPAIGNPFTDVYTNDYYYQAALWAYEKGLVSGTRFNGSQACTRAATVGYLWKLAGSPAATSSGFSDVSAGTETASAVNWAVAKGITNGMSATTFEPATTCNRGQIATFLYRAYA